MDSYRLQYLWSVAHNNFTVHTMIPSATDERYKLLRTVADSYSILSMGVACFQWQPEGTTPSTCIPCKTEVFNIWLLSQTTYNIDPGSAKFLIAHGFDFNKQFRSGLPYSPVGSTTAYSRAGNNMVSTLITELGDICMIHLLL